MNEKRSKARRTFLVVGVIAGLVLFTIRLMPSSPQFSRLRLSDDPKSVCGPKPNSVSSLSDLPDHSVQPLEVTGSSVTVFGDLTRVVLQLPRTTIVDSSESEGYLHAECRSRLCRFVDDLECVIDSQTGTIHVRSASRTGYSDLGVNRKRIESLRAIWTSREKRDQPTE